MGPVRFILGRAANALKYWLCSNEAVDEHVIKSVCKGTAMFNSIGLQLNAQPVLLSRGGEETWRFHRVTWLMAATCCLHVLRLRGRAANTGFSADPTGRSHMTP